MVFFIMMFWGVSLLNGMEIPAQNKNQNTPDFLTPKKIFVNESPDTLFAVIPQNYGFWKSKDGALFGAEISKVGQPTGRQRSLSSDEGYLFHSLVSPSRGFGYLWKKMGQKYYLVSLFPGILTHDDSGFCTKILKADKPYPLACFDQDILLIRRETDIIEADIEARILLKKQQVVYRKPEGKKFPDYAALHEASRMPIAVTNSGTVVCMDECGEIELLQRDSKTHQLMSVAHIVAFHNMPYGKLAIHREGYLFAYDTQRICIAQLDREKRAFAEIVSLPKKCDAISVAFHPTKILAAVACASNQKKAEIIFLSPKKSSVAYAADIYVTDLQWPTEGNVLFGMCDGKSVRIVPQSE